MKKINYMLTWGGGSFTNKNDLSLKDWRKCYLAVLPKVASYGK